MGARIVTLSAQRLAYGLIPLEPAETKDFFFRVKISSNVFPASA